MMHRILPATTALFACLFACACASTNPVYQQLSQQVDPDPSPGDIHGAWKNDWSTVGGDYALNFLFRRDGSGYSFTGYEDGEEDPFTWVYSGAGEWIITWGTFTTKFRITRDKSRLLMKTGVHSAILSRFD